MITWDRDMERALLKARPEDQVGNHKGKPKKKKSDDSGKRPKH